MLVVVALHRTVGGLVLIYAGRAHQDACHHGQAAESARDHVAHHIAVVVLARPNKAALSLHHTRHRIIDERVEILDARLRERRSVFAVKDLLENVLEAVVVRFGDGVLRGEPDVLPRIKRIVETAARKTCDGRIKVMHALSNAGAAELMNERAGLPAVRRRVDKLHLARTGNEQLRILVDIAVRMTRQRDGLLPVAHARLNALAGDGRAEHRSVKDGADGAVGALPHLLETVFLHARGVGRDSGALHSHAQALRCLGGIDGNLVIGGVTIGKAQVVILGFKVYEGANELIFDHLPNDASHLVAVHFDKRHDHGDLLTRYGSALDHNGLLMNGSSIVSRRRESNSQRMSAIIMAAKLKPGYSRISGNRATRAPSKKQSARKQQALLGCR